MNLHIYEPNIYDLYGVNKCKNCHGLETECFYYDGMCYEINDNGFFIFWSYMSYWSQFIFIILWRLNL